MKIIFILSVILLLSLSGCVPDLPDSYIPDSYIPDPDTTSTARVLSIIASSTAFDATNDAFISSKLQTQTAEPPGTPRPTPDRETRFNNCISSGMGVRYVIKGERVSAVSLAWENDTNGTEQGDYGLNFCKTYSHFLPGDFLYISAQIIEPTENAGSIKCYIYVGDTIIAEGRATGYPSITTCSGSR